MKVRFTCVVRSTYRHAILLHGMAELVSLLSPTREETVLAQVCVEAFKASVSEAYDGILLADVAFGLVSGGLRRGQSVHHGKPHQ